MGSLVAGAKYRGESESDLKLFIKRTRLPKDKLFYSLMRFTQ
jgi:ATP-dependent Clp protease ATP-binding subunit ClpA